MKESTSNRPAIFAMSNPTKNGLLLWDSLSFAILLQQLKFILMATLFGFIFYEIAECTAADAFKYAGDNIVFASGSPFENVNLGNFPSCQ